MGQPDPRDREVSPVFQVCQERLDPQGYLDLKDLQDHRDKMVRTP